MPAVLPVFAVLSFHICTKHLAPMVGSYDLSTCELPRIYLPSYLLVYSSTRSFFSLVHSAILCILLNIPFLIASAVILGDMPFKTRPVVRFVLPRAYHITISGYDHFDPTPGYIVCGNIYAAPGPGEWIVASVYRWLNTWFGVLLDHR